MSHELICSWLGLPPNHWPPDHYRLLGLDPGESDVALIEQRVHQRVDSVRRYQMMHPEQATEAMNRLAQAFVCLTEPDTKKSYDEQLLGARPRLPPPPLPAAVPHSNPPPLPRDPLVWLYTPGANVPGQVPPVRVPPLPPLPPLPPPVEEVVAPVVVAPVVVAPPPELIDPVVEAAQQSRQARRGLGTRRHLLERIYQTRHLLRLWYRLGRHLDDPERTLSRGDASDLYKLIGQVEDGIEEFPLLGEAGQPGYLIISLTQLDKSRELLNLTYRERESLQRDWKAGLKFLAAHRAFLRRELIERRGRSRLRRLARAAATLLGDYPLAALLLAGGLTALVIAAWRTYF